MHFRQLNIAFLLVFILFAEAFSTSFSDDFTGGGTPPSGWTQSGAAVAYTSNGAYCYQSTGWNGAGYLINNNTLTSDGQYTVIFDSVGNSPSFNPLNGGVVFRYSNTSSYYFVSIVPGAGSGSVNFYVDNLGSSGGTVVANGLTIATRNVTLLINIAGTTFTFYINGSNVGSVTNASHSSGQVGLAANQGNSWTRYDKCTWTEAPSAPTLSFPANSSAGQSLTPTMQWNLATGATSYRVQVSTHSDCSSPTYDVSGVVATSQLVTPALLGSTVYYWRVNATNSAGTSGYSSIWSFTTQASAATDNYANWTFSKNITLRTTVSGAGVSNDVSNFPVLLRLNPGNFNGFANTNTGGGDIRFSKTDGTHLPYQIERWVNNAGNNDTAEIWVLIPTVKGNDKSQSFKMYWGNIAAADSSNGGKVFDTANGFVGVWHLNTSGTGKRPDATANNDSAKVKGGASYTAGGLIAGCDTFIAANNQYDSVASGVSLAGGSFSVSVWFKLAVAAPGSDRPVIGQGIASADNGLHMEYRQSASKLSIDFYTDGLNQTNTYSGGTIWHFLSATYNTTGKVQSLYVDGLLDNSRTATANYSGTGAFLIGRNPQGAVFDGNIDEVVVSNVVRSADWMKLCFQNQQANQTLVDMDDYSQWNYTRKIKLNTYSTGADVATPQQSFPVLIRLSNTSFDFSQAQDSGQDIRFSKADGSHLVYQVDTWDKANKTAAIWVRVDTVLGNNSTQYINMYWGNSTVASKSNGAAVFDTSNGFVGVWHLNGTGTQKRADATANNDSASCVGATYNPIGIICGYDSVNAGINQYDSVPSGVNLANQSFTISAWSKFVEAVPSYSRYIIGQGTGTADNGLHFGFRQTSGKYTFAFYSDDLDQASAYNGGTGWHYFAGTFSTSTKLQSLFADGALDNSRTATGNYVGTGPFFIGHSPATGDRFDGDMDEIVVSNVVRSADWIKLCYQNQKANQTFVDLEDYSRWNYSKNLNINTTVNGADVPNNVVAFPLLVKLTGSNFNFSQAKDDGSDIRFAKPNGDHCAYVIDEWDRVNQNASVWVKIDTVYGNNGTQYVSMFWGNSGATAMDNSDVVFDTANGFVGVWHLGESGAGSRFNYAPLGYSGNTHNYTGNESTAGVIGNADSITGTKYLDCSNISITGNLTLSGWVNPVAYANYGRIIGKQWSTNVSPYQVYSLHFTATNPPNAYMKISVGGAIKGVQSLSTIPLNQWTYLTGTYNGSALNVYFNGLSEATSAATGAIDSKSTLTTIGANDSTPAERINGLLDEIRLEKVARSADWIKLCYQNQKPNQVLVDADDYSKWICSKNIVINTNGLSLSGPVLKFPYLVRLTSSNFNFSQALGNGQDIRFSKANGTHLQYEIERWDRANQLAEMWVKVDTIFKDSAQQYIKMYWGNTAASNTSNGASVFDTANGFVSVYHLNDVNVTTGYKDATANGFNATGHSMAVTDTVTSVIAKGQVFNGSSKYLSIASGINLSGKNITVSAWAKLGASGLNQWIASQGTAANDNCLQFNYTSGNTFSFGFWNDDLPTAGTYTSTATWYNWVATYNASTKAQILYLNGAQNITRNATASFAGSGEFDIARYLPNANGYFNGTVNELRVEDTVRSADWIKLCYGNQVTGSTITTLDSSDAYRPLSIKRYNGGADSIYIGTTRWAIKFAKNAGGGIKFLAQDSASANQLDKNMFYLLNNGSESDTGTGTITMLDSSIVFARVRQSKTMAGQPWTIDYTVLGSGKLFARVTTYAAAAVSGGLEFRIANNATANYDNIQYGPTAAACQAVMHVDSGSRKYDLLMVPFDLWPQATTVTATSKYAGIDANAWTANAGMRRTWNFMIDFSHKSLHDSAAAWKYINDYRNSDTLGWFAGTALCEKAWEKYLVGHWKMDEKSGDTAFDASASISGNGYAGTIRGGGKWTSGMWGNGDSLDGTDSIRVWPGASANFNNASRGFTIMGWVKPAVPMTAATMLFRQRNSTTGYNLSGYAGGAAAFAVGNGSSTRTLPGVTVLDPGQWYHVAAEETWQQDTMKLFINGNLDTMKTLGSGYPAGSTDSVTMGASFNGVLDDMRFYQYNLTDQEIKAIYLKGYSPDLGMYSVRADNNGQMQCLMHGVNSNRILPVFQIANYWSSNNPPTNVYVDSQLLSNGTDYFTALDQSVRTLTVGFNRTINANSTIFVGNSAIGQSAMTTMPQMLWGQATVGTANHVWVKNFSGNYFGTSATNNFFFDWKMTYGNATNTKNGEMWYYSSSVTNPSALLDTNANINCVPGYNAGYSGSFGQIGIRLANSNTPTSNKDVDSAFTYSIAESSSVRVLLDLYTRKVKNSTDSFHIDTRWAIYPTGQIWRWDSISYLSGAVKSVWTGFYEDSLNLPTITLPTPHSKLRGGFHSTTMPDFVSAKTGFRNSRGIWAQPWVADTLRSIANNGRLGVEFYDATTNPDTMWGNVPVQFALYADLQQTNVTSGRIDSIGCSVQHFQNPALTILNGNGVLQKHTWGDLDTNGFSEGEGAYIISATNNTVQFTVLASAADTSCRYNPAFRITNYTSATEPQYVLVGPSGSEKLLAKNYGYNVYLNKTRQEVIVQLNQTFCTNTNVYISYDKTLAVTMDRFIAFPGDRNDTLRWRTESELQNLGFNLYRRIKPAFLDSAIASNASSKADTSDPVISYLRKGFVKQEDTGWVAVNSGGIIRGAAQGKSVGPRNYSFVDYRVLNDIRYEYKIEAIDYTQNTSLYKDYAEALPRRAVPLVFELSGNYPNPFRLATMIRYALPVKTKVDLYVYTLQGRLIRKLVNAQKQDVGFYRIGWDAKDARNQSVASGPYIYRIGTPQFSKSKIMILAR